MTQIKYKHDDFYMFPYEREREIERNLWMDGWIDGWINRWMDGLKGG